MKSNKMKSNKTKSNKMNPRTQRLMPGGVPRYIRCYYEDSRELEDPYTVVFTGLYPGREACDYLGLSACASIVVYGSQPFVIDAREGWAPAIGRRNHLGKRIPFGALPRACRKVAVENYKDFWELP